MMKKYLLLCGVLVTAMGAKAGPTVWSTDVAPIIYNHCASCHHSGGIAPFSLVEYAEAVAQATSIQHDVTEGSMPPWPPDRNYSRFAHERVLTAAEVNTIVNWVSDGTPPGDLSLAPPPPVYTATGSLPGTPDLIVRIPTYTSTAATGDLYQCFTMPSGLLADKYITAMEAIPGNPAMVHHVLVFSDTTGDCAALDAASPGPGYPNFGGVGSSNATMIGAWVPGGGPMTYPSGFGLKLAHNADVVFQIHYPAGTSGLQDSTEVHFFFAPTTAGIRDLYIVPILNHESNINAPINIPANTTRTYHEQQGIPFDITLLGLAPHMHLLGQNIRSYSVIGTDTTKLIDIPHWDFHWQGFYSFPRLIHIPTLSTLHADAFYDNTTANPENPNSPPLAVTAGESTTDEMMLIYFIFTGYMPGDEHIIVDSAVALNTPDLNSNYYRGQQLLNTYPNPSSEYMVVKCFFDEGDKATIDMTDMNGRIIKQYLQDGTVNKGYNTFKYSVADLPDGNYILRMRTTQRSLTQKLTITH